MGVAGGDGAGGEGGIRTEAAGGEGAVKPQGSSSRASSHRRRPRRSLGVELSGVFAVLVDAARRRVGAVESRLPGLLPPSMKSQEAHSLVTQKKRGAGKITLITF